MGVLVLALFLPLLSALVGDEAVLPALLLVLVLGFNVRVAVRHAKRRKAQQERERLEAERVQAPCDHGVRGAAMNSALCPNCSKAAVEHEEARRREAEETAHWLEEDRRRHEAEWRAKIRLPEYLKNVHPQEFERIVLNLYERLGYKVKATPYVGDSGIDGFLQRGTASFVLQAKRFEGTVGEPVLRDLFGSMHAAKANGAVLVTTGTLSRRARQWAEGKPIEVVQLTDLIKLIEQAYPENDLVPPDFNIDSS